VVRRRRLPANSIVESGVAWATDVGKLWWAVVAAALVVLALFTFVASVRRHWELLAIAALAVLLALSFWAYHKQRTRLGLNDLRRAALATKLTALIREGQRIRSLSDNQEIFTASHDFAVAGYAVIHQAIGPPYDADFQIAPAPPASGSLSSRAMIPLKQGVQRRLEILGTLYQEVDSLKILEDWEA